VCVCVCKIRPKILQAPHSVADTCVPLISRIRCMIADGLGCVAAALASEFCRAAATLDRRPTTKPTPEDAPRTATATSPMPANAVASPPALSPPSPAPRRLLLIPVASAASLVASPAKEEPIWHWQAHWHRQVSPSSGALVVVVVDTTTVDVDVDVGGGDVDVDGGGIDVDVDGGGEAPAGSAQIFHPGRVLE